MNFRISNGILLMLLSSACASRSRSLALGGSSGFVIGATSGSIVAHGDNVNRQISNTLIGAGIGLGVGLLSSYLLHNYVEERIENLTYEEDERIRFGDLPPNPFSPSNQINKPKRNK